MRDAREIGVALSYPRKSPFYSGVKGGRGSNVLTASLFYKSEPAMIYSILILLVDVDS